MGLTSTAKKLQQTIDIAEDLYKRMNDLRDRIVGMEETVAETNERIDALEGALAEQRALVEALAEQQGIDVDDAVADATGDGGTDAHAPAGEADATGDADAPTPDGND